MLPPPIDRTGTTTSPAPTPRDPLKATALGPSSLTPGTSSKTTRIQQASTGAGPSPSTKCSTCTSVRTRAMRRPAFASLPTWPTNSRPASPYATTTTRTVTEQPAEDVPRHRNRTRVNRTPPPPHLNHHGPVNSQTTSIPDRPNVRPAGTASAPPNQSSAPRKRSSTGGSSSSMQSSYCCSAPPSYRRPRTSPSPSSDSRPQKTPKHPGNEVQDRRAITMCNIHVCPFSCIHVLCSPGLKPFFFAPFLSCTDSTKEQKILGIPHSLVRA